MKFWSASAFMDSTQLVPIASMLDEAGYHGMMLSDHICYPRDLQSKYPYSPTGDPIWDPETAWPDSWVTIGAMSSVTERLRLSNNVYIAPNRPLLATAKQVATAAVLSHDRVTLGIAAGWMREEFELMGQDFDNRGPRTDEMIQALRELWKPGWVEFHGEYYDVPAMTLGPVPDEPVPIYVGGHSKPALRRAARYGDGWVGNAYPWDEAVRVLGALREQLEAHGRSDDEFEMVIGFYEQPSVELYRRAAEELGVSSVLCLPWADIGAVSQAQRDGLLQSAEIYRDSIMRFADEFVVPLADL